MFCESLTDVAAGRMGLSKWMYELTDNKESGERILWSGGMHHIHVWVIAHVKELVNKLLMFSVLYAGVNAYQQLNAENSDKISSRINSPAFPRG